MTSSKPFHVIVAGAGVAGLETALALRELARDEVSVELVAPETDFVYRPLSVAAPFEVDETRHFPLQRLAADAGAALTHDRVTGVDAAAKTVALASGAERSYDALVLALGARPGEAIPGALTFGGPDDEQAISTLLESIAGGDVRSVVFAAVEATWPLPLYELALLTAEFAADRGSSGVEVVVVTPEEAPLALFGPAASDAMRELLDIRGVHVETRATVYAAVSGELLLAGGPSIRADAVVALPKLVPPRLEGIPCDDDGFVATDELGCVLGLVDVYAAGDMTQFPVKQGGLAAQQADAVASTIAADAGARVRPEPFAPVLRGLLLTGMAPRYLRTEPGETASLVDTEPLWWPPAKIVGRYLSPFLAEHLGQPSALTPPDREALPIEVELDRGGKPTWTPI